MNGWMTVWTVTLIGGLGAFAVLAVVVAIGGFFDVIAMLRALGPRSRRRKPETPDASRGAETPR